MKNPDGRFKCLACGSEWSGWQLHLDPTSTAVRWTCGDPFCGGTVVRVEAAVPKAIMSIKNEKIWELYQKWLIPEGRVADVISTEVQEYERSISELTRINKKQRNEIAGLRRQNDLLRTVDYRANELINKMCYPEYDERALSYLEVRQAAVDGGALED